MVDLQEIERAMHTLACGETTFDTVARLAALITVHDHLTAENPDNILSPYSAQQAPAAMPHLSGSDFLDAASAAPMEDVMEILDEHMEALRVVIPREYEAVLERIKRVIP